MLLRETYCVFHRRGSQILEVLSKILPNSDNGDVLIYPHLSCVGLWDACAGNQFLKAFRLQRKATRITANLIPENLLDHNVKSHNFLVVSKFLRLFYSICLNVPWQRAVTYMGMRHEAETITELGGTERQLMRFCLHRSVGSFHQHIAKFQKQSLTCKNRKRRSNLS